MTAATIDDDSIDIEEQIENPKPRHLLRLREGRVIGAHTDNYDIVGRVLEEGELDVGPNREVGVIVSVYILAGVDEFEYAYLIYSNESHRETMKLSIVGRACGGDEIQSLEVVTDE